MTILAFYFSGTGNTKFVVESMVEAFSKLDVQMEAISIESDQAMDVDKINAADYILFAYPVYGAMAPMIMWRFVKEISPHLEDKKAMVVATQMMFSGDGGAYLARILRKCKAEIVSIEHFIMPNNLSDVRMLRTRNGDENRKRIEKTLQSIELYCLDTSKKRLFKRGDGVGSILLGCTTRIPFSKMEKKLTKNVKFHKDRCTLCGDCIALCPVQNLMMGEGQIDQKGDCTLCYRCVNRCPEKAISLLASKPPKSQYLGVNFKDRK
ncbi:MAG TPA: hypothetical protein DCS67_05225 [Clostridiales bacterium UBA8960]|jgi:ferredoxin/flavodoxin|nr:hypothetical protein [Clostridiales bacterium UBA8960]